MTLNDVIADRGIVSGVAQSEVRTVMGWETRGNSRYYYRKQREGGRVVSKYIGAGYVAGVLAELDDIERQERQWSASAWRTVVQTERQSVMTLAQIDDLVKSAVAAVLITNGYHTHNRQWRRKRDE